MLFKKINHFLYMCTFVSKLALGVKLVIPKFWVLTNSENRRYPCKSQNCEKSRWFCYLHIFIRGVRKVNLTKNDILDVSAYLWNSVEIILLYDNAYEKKLSTATYIRNSHFSCFLIISQNFEVIFTRLVKSNRNICISVLFCQSCH